MMTLVRLEEGFSTLPNMACVGRGIQPAVRCGWEKRCAAALHTSLLKCYTSNRSAKVIQSPYTSKVSVETTLGFGFKKKTEVGDRSYLLAFLTTYLWRNEKEPTLARSWAPYIRFLGGGKSSKLTRFARCNVSVWKNQVHKQRGIHFHR